MSYYRPQMGDYRTYGYGGDPGFFSSIGKFLKKAVPIAAGFLTGGVGGAVLAGIGSKTSRPSVPAPLSFPGVGFGPGTGLPTGPGGAGAAWPTAGQLAAPGTGARGAFPVNGCCPAGYHPDKATGTKCVKNRTMNVSNPRALRRAIRREKGFGKLASRVGYVKRKSGSRRVAACK